MTKTEAKKLVKNDLYGAIYELQYQKDFESFHNLKEIIFRVLDNIDNKTLQKAINKGTR